MNRTDTFTDDARGNSVQSVGFNASPNDCVRCQMCKTDIPATNATIASVFADGDVAFACEVHRITLRQWLLFWWRFNNAQGLVGVKELEV